MGAQHGAEPVTHLIVQRSYPVGRFQILEGLRMKRIQKEDAPTCPVAMLGDGAHPVEIFVLIVLKISADVKMGLAD